MGSWTLETISWDRFDASKVDPEILRNIKAASLVERNAGDYGIYLGRVFADDPSFTDSVKGWPPEAIHHATPPPPPPQPPPPASHLDAAFARFRPPHTAPLHPNPSPPPSHAPHPPPPPHP